MQVRPEEVELIRRDYAANGSWETFLEYGDPRQDILVGLLRLRRVQGAGAERQPALRGRCSIVRELHVYGTAVAVHARDAAKFQHQVRAGGAGPSFFGGGWAGLYFLGGGASRVGCFWGAGGGVWCREWNAFAGGGRALPAWRAAQEHSRAEDLPLLGLSGATHAPPPQK